MLSAVSARYVRQLDIAARKAGDSTSVGNRAGAQALLHEGMAFRIDPIPLTPSELKIHKEILRAAGRFHSAQSELLDLIQEVDRTRIFVKLGQKSCFAYCVSELKLSEDMTCNLTTVARKSFEVPELKQAVKEGLSIAKARKICAIITPENQEHWIRLARNLTYAELDREIAREFPKERVKESAKAVGGDRFKITLGLDGDALELFRQVQDLVSTKRNIAATLEETLIEIMEEYADRHHPLAKAERARKAGADHEVNQRDGNRCQAENPDGTLCGATRWLHKHHVVPRSLGGTDEPENLITLCSFHHQLFHRTEGYYPPCGERPESNQAPPG